MQNMLLVAGLALGQAAVAQQVTATLITPPTAIETFIVGAGGGRAVGNFSFLLDPAPFPDARGVHAFVYDAATGVSTDLHPSPTFSASFALGARGGQQVGFGFTSGPNIALLWRGSAASAVLLNTSGTDSTVASATDGTTQVGAAILPTSGGSSRAFAWTGTAASGRALAHPFGFESSTAGGIRGGRIVGNGEDANFLFAGLYWPSLNAQPVIVRPSGFDEAFLADVDGNQLLGEGYGSRTGGQRFAFLWDVNDLENPVSLHPASPDYENSRATALLPKSAAFPTGIQVGNVDFEDIPDTGDFFAHAAVWFGSADSFIDLHNALPEGLPFSYAEGIDDAGNVYGWTQDRFGNFFGVVWSISAACSPADLALPLGTLNIFDIFEYFNAFATGDLARADVAPTGAPDGVLNVFDIFQFFAIFAAGC